MIRHYPSLRRNVLCALILAGVSLSGQSKSTHNLDALIRQIRSSVNPDKTMGYMRTIYSTDRYFTFPAFEKTAQYLQSAMRGAGLEQATVVNPPADGRTQVGFWTMPLAWDVKSARLEILDGSLSAEQRFLADYEKVPASVGMWSGSTPAGGVEAEVIAASVADLRQPEKLDLRGKLVLMDVNPAGQKWLLAKYGALGAINAFTENPELKDDRQWINAWGDSGWGYTKTSTPLLSFSIAPNQAALLRSLLAKGPVRVKATVDSRYYEGSYPYVTGVVRGTNPEEEVLALAHTAEQGAQDNATGVAAVLESAGVLNRLISEGKLPRPRRSIRILLMPEMYGSMHYVANNPERIRKTAAAICVDTPAASYALTGTEYTFFLNPHVAKDFTDAFIMKVASSYLPLVKRPWHEKEFTTGTDTYLAEPMVGIPTVWPYSGSGVETHHNSADTPDDVDPRSLRDLATITAAFLYYIAEADTPEALWLASLSETRGYGQILKRTEPVLNAFLQAGNAEEVGRLLASAEDQIAYAVDRESHAVASVRRLVSSERAEALEKEIEPMLHRLRKFGKQQRSRAEAVAHRRNLQLGGTSRVQPLRSKRAGHEEASRIVVRRKRFGTLPLDDLPHEQWEGQPSGAWALVPTIALYWCDGRRNLAEVIRLTELELGPTKFDFVRYFRFLQKRGYVDFVR